jgi:hypothetical protein
MMVKVGFMGKTKEFMGKQKLFFAYILGHQREVFFAYISGRGEYIYIDRIT